MPTRIASWEAKRGRQDELEKTGTGTATILVHDVDGDYDPNNPSSPYYGQLDGAPVALSLYNPVTASWHTRFQGTVDEYTYDLSARQNNVNVQISCVDGFDYLAAAEMTTTLHGTHTPAEVNADEGTVVYEADDVQLRIWALLEDAQWPLDRTKIFTGNVYVQRCIYNNGYSFLAGIQDAADAEFPGVANVYMDAVGDVVFHGRLARFDPEATAASAGAQWVFTRWKVGDGAAIAGDSSYAQARPPLQSDRSLKMVYNAVLIHPTRLEAPFEAEAAETDAEFQARISDNIRTDEASIAQFGVRSYPATEVRTLRHKNNGNDRWEETGQMSDYYMGHYSQPRTRPRQITVKSVWPNDPRAAATWAFLCGVEISDIIHLNVSYPGGGGIDEDFFVEGITTICRPLQPDFDYVEVVCDVSPAEYWNTDPFGPVLMGKLFLPRHAKTHLPGGSDPLTPGQIMTWRGEHSGTQTITSEELVKWREFENMDETIYTEGVVDGSGDFTHVNIWEPGTYAVTAHYQWSTIPDGDLYWIAVHDQWGAPNTLYQTNEGWHQLGGDITMAFTKTFPPSGETVASASSRVARIQVYAGHDPSGGLTIGNGLARLEIAFLGALHPSITWHD